MEEPLCESRAFADLYRQAMANVVKISRTPPSVARDGPDGGRTPEERAILKLLEQVENLEKGHRPIVLAQRVQPDPGPPPLLADPDGEDGQPDPLEATSEEHLLDLLRQFHRWAGGYSSRQLAKWSGGAFSHTTVSALLSEGSTAKRPPLKLTYLQGVIRACGGGEEELKRWTKAWRRVHTKQARPAKVAVLDHWKQAREQAR